MELRHLRYLVAVAETSTFSGAAQQLGVAQPALTRQLHEFERELGTPFFVPGARRATLTPAGEAAVHVARQTLDAIRQAVERVRLAQRGLAGRCVVGVSRGPLLEGMHARLIQLGRIRCPRITIEIVESEFPAMWTAVADGIADVGMGQPPPRTYPMLAAETQQHVIADHAIVAPDHPLVSRQSIRLEELLGLPFVWVGTADDAEQIYALARRELLRRGTPAEAMRFVPSIEAGLAVIKANHGWSLVQQRLATALRPGVIGVPLEDFAVPFRFARIWRRADQRPVTQTVIDLLRAIEREGRDERVQRRPEDETGVDTFVPPRLELRHLRTYVRVVESGSLGRAAEELGVTQPALSRQMRDLAHDVGVPLLERESRGASPTLAGESLYKDACEILAAVDGLEASAQRAERGASGRCILGAGPLPPVQDIVTHTLRHCASHYASMEIVVTDRPWPKLPGALRNSVIDVGLGHGPHASRPTPGLRRIILARDPLDTALVSPQHEAARRGSVSLEELAATPFIFISRSFSSIVYDRVMAAFSERGFAPRIDSSYDGLHTMWSMVSAGLGWALGSHSQRAVPPPGTVPLALEFFFIPWDVELLYRRDETRAPVLAVIDIIRRHSAGLPGVSAPDGFGTFRSDTPKAAIP